MEVEILIAEAELLSVSYSIRASFLYVDSQTVNLQAKKLFHNSRRKFDKSPCYFSRKQCSAIE